MKILVYDGYI